MVYKSAHQVSQSNDPPPRLISNKPCKTKGFPLLPLVLQHPQSAVAGE